MSERPPALRARDLSVARAGKRVVDTVNFEAQHGSVLAVLGPNGAGKSTLLRAVAGLLPYSGSAALDSQEVSALTRRSLARQVAFVPQRSLLASPMRVRAVVTQGRYAHQPGLTRPRAADEAAVDHALAVTRSDELAERYFTELSYGEQRRVLLARALATGAEILLLDEPTASLDINHSLSLFGLLRALALEGRCVVVVLHHLEEARRFADRALLLHHGRSVAYGDVREVISTEHIASVYGVHVVEGGAPSFRLAGDAAP
jgi:iron complex transport system ATP-binding protein